MIKKSEKNMYSDSIKQWNVIVGCKFDCIYCKKSFQAQMKRQMPKFDENGKQYRGCKKCYDYEPHFHEDRLTQSLPNTKGDEFIWACSSGDISFAFLGWTEKVLNRIRELPHKTFFMQTKNPFYFNYFELPNNLIIGTTLETNREKGYKKISKALLPQGRVLGLINVNHNRKFITIEPILEFDLDILVYWIKMIKPKRVYVGYDTKNNKLPEPLLDKTMKLIDELKKFTKVKTKLLRKAWNE